MMKSLTVIIVILFASSALVTAQAECAAQPPDGLKPIAAFSIFQSNYKNKDYQFALKYGRWILCSKPKTIEDFPSFDLSRQMDKFTTIYQEIAKNETDPSIKATYLDSALMIFEEKIILFKEDKEEMYQTHQQKGRFYLENNSLILNVIKIIHGRGVPVHTATICK